jgi:hypothetical protein
MGTSSSYTAPTSGGWPAAKGAATRFASQGGTDAGPIEPRQVTRSYVQALGGAAAAAASALAGQAATAQLGQFLSSVASNGLIPTLQREGLSVPSGSDTTDILMGLVDRLASTNRTLEESTARAAMVVVLEGAFGQAETLEDFDALCTQSLDGTGVLQLLKQFLTEYVYQRMIQTMGDRLLNGARTSTDLCRVEEDLHEFIIADINLEFAGINPLTLDWGGQEASQVIERLMTDAYGQLE